jgi:hypothetical protein
MLGQIMLSRIESIQPIPQLPVRSATYFIALTAPSHYWPLYQQV